MSSGKRYKVLVFGNPMLTDDSLPLRIMPRLAKLFPRIEFKEFDPNENLEKEGKELNILDSVEGLRKATIITDIDSIMTRRIYSMHDFDLGYSLKLLKKLHYIDSVRIFGVPMRIGEKEAVEQVSALLISSLS